MFSSMAGEAILSLFLDCAGDADPAGANTALLLAFRDSHQPRRYLSALRFQPDLGWAGTLIIKKTEKQVTPELQKRGGSNCRYVVSRFICVACSPQLSHSNTGGDPLPSVPKRMEESS